MMFAIKTAFKRVLAPNAALLQTQFSRRRFLHPLSHVKMESDAQAYNELNKPQYVSGSKFIRELNLSEGNKVLDMGCGTGDLTKYISGIVGSDGLVVGVDPDEARIKIAEEKFQGARNLQFHVSDSTAGFPHDNEEYFDLHISTHTFHWLKHEEKKLYLQKAFRCLKQGGKLAILCMKQPETDERVDQHNLFSFNMLTEDGYRELFNEVGLFTNIVITDANFQAQMKSMDELKRWLKASTHHDLDELDPAYLKKVVLSKYFTQQEDGSACINFFCAGITAAKSIMN